MNLSQFVTWALGQGTVAKYTDGQYGGECVSLINQYLARVYGIKAGSWGHAKDWPTNGNVLQYFDIVPSPQAGDIGVSGATAGNPYGHIWIYTSPTTIIEQNGRIARRISVGSAYLKPIAILRRKGTGGSNVVIGSGDNWYWRLEKLHQQVRGRTLGRDVFAQFIGKDTLSFIEAISDDPEANAVQHAQTVGTVAVRDNWQGQINALQAQVSDLNSRPTKEQLAELQAKADTLAKSADDAAKAVEEKNKKIAELEKSRTEDTQLLDEAGSWFSKLFNRLFKKG